MTKAGQDVFSDAPTIVTIEGVEYTVNPITQGNLCRVVKWFKSQWLQEFLDGTRMVPLPDGDRGAAISQIIMKSAPITEVLADYEANLRLMSMQILADGKPIPFESLREEMNPNTCRTLSEIMHGVNRKDSTEPTDAPLSSSTSTTKAKA